MGVIMDEIINYKLKDFFKQKRELIEEYLQYLIHLEPIDTINEIFHLSLKDVETIKQLIQSSKDIDLIELLCIVQGYDEIKLPNWLKKLNIKYITNWVKNSRYSKVMNLRIVEVYGLINSVKKQLEQINSAEINSLQSDVTNFKWEAVNGSERLKKFGIYNTLESLSNGDITKWNQIMEMPYSEVFTKLLMNKINGELQNEMNQIKTTN